MLRMAVMLLLGSASYGFSIGFFHSSTYALRNMIKFPLLIFCTATICAMAYFLVSRLLGVNIGFRSVQRLSADIFAGVSLLLASLAIPNLFLALTLDQPTSAEALGAYPLFQGFNVLLIAICGCLALVRQGGRLLAEHGLNTKKAFAMIFVWLALSLPVGGQGAWFLRPFFGISALPHLEDFCLGTRPDWRGDTNFFEAVYHIVSPPGGNQ